MALSCNEFEFDELELNSNDSGIFKSLEVDHEDIDNAEINPNIKMDFEMDNFDENNYELNISTTDYISTIDEDNQLIVDDFPEINESENVKTNVQLSKYSPVNPSIKIEELNDYSNEIESNFNIDVLLSENENSTESADNLNTLEFKNSFTKIEQKLDAIFSKKINDNLKVKQMENLFTKSNIKQSSKISYYYAWTCFIKGDYDLVIKICLMNSFPDYLHEKMQHLWKQSQEMLELVRKKKKKLTSLQRFRLIQKYPYPRTIWNGVRIKYGMPEASKQFLINFYENINKKPTKKEKEQLAKVIGKSVRVGKFNFKFNFYF